MKCPHCGGRNSRVIDTREAGDGIRRRRECKDCNQRFTTYERVALFSPMIVKRDGRREPFDRDKLMRGIQKACAKRPIAVEDLERLVSQVEHRVHSLGKAEVDSRVVGDMVMEGLRELDDVAYILFASVYIPLADLESMKQEVDRLMERR
ncbi:MAG TPA: transcriptional repressor NrdR [Anaerolineae bacterium]|nr:transcriptional repressor NrdR [Anaerolineae bacterium]